MAAKYLGRLVSVPPNGEKWRLVEIYSNGNVACVPKDCTNYEYQIKEFHITSIFPSRPSEEKNGKRTRINGHEDF